MRLAGPIKACYNLFRCVPNMGGNRRIYPIYGGKASPNPNDANIWGIQRIKENVMRCPYCSHKKTRVIDTSHDTRGGTRRRRVCDGCGQRFSSYERPILATPMLIKRDGTREEFSRDKLISGLWVACAKRPISAADVEGIAGEIEAELQQLGRSELKSRYVGDMAIRKLKALDEVAYVRYAIVYLGLSDLESIRNEIDQLLGE